MGDKAHTPLPKLRTFQLDQAQARGEEPVKVPEKKAFVTAPKLVVTTAKKEPPPAVEKISVVDTSAPLVPPSFHELKKNAPKKIEHIIAEAAPKTVVVRKKAAPPPRSFSSEATVITFAKKNEFNFFRAIATSLKSWLAGFSSKKKVSHYTVSPIDRRREIVERATTNSGAVYNTNIDELKQELSKKHEEIPVSQKLHLNWSPQTEPGFPLIDKPGRTAKLPDKLPVQVEYKKRALPTVPVSESVTKVEQYQKRVFVPPPETAPSRVSNRWESDFHVATDSPYAATKVTESVPSTTSPIFGVPDNIQSGGVSTASVFAAPIAPVSVPVVVSSVIPNNQDSLISTLDLTKPGTTIPNKPNPRSSYLRSGLRQLFRFDTTIATVVVVGSMVSFLMVFLIIRTFLNMIIPSETTSDNVVSLAEPLSPEGKVIDVAVSAVTSEALFSALQGESKPASGVVEFRILEANGAVAPGHIIWDAFGFSSNPNLSRSILETRLGYSEGEHLLIFKVTDAVTVFGALLIWEPNMSAELTPIFENPSNNRDSFTDLTIKNNDVRILKVDAEEILVYGFIDSNTVVITESLEAYKAALGSK